MARLGQDDDFMDVHENTVSFTPKKKVDHGVLEAQTRTVVLGDSRLQDAYRYSEKEWRLHGGALAPGCCPSLTGSWRWSQRT